MNSLKIIYIFLLFIFNKLKIPHWYNGLYVLKLDTFCYLLLLNILSYFNE